MRDALKAYLALAGGLVEVPRQRALTAAKALVAQGETTAEQVTSLAEDLVSQSRANREAVSALVKYEVDRTLGRVGLASSEEVGTLAARVQALEVEVRTLRHGAPGTPAEGQTRGRRATASAPAKAPTKKAAAKRAPAKKAAVNKAPAKRAAEAPVTTATAASGPSGEAAGGS